MGNNLHREERPWGFFSIVDQGPVYQVKRLSVHPGGCLSLQRHTHRSEVWVVVSGSAHATVGEKTVLLNVGDSIFIQKEALHRLENKGADLLVIIETQMGDYLGEDDILRLEDKYGRHPISPLPEKPRALVCDFDGVFTDNRVLVSETGEESVFCDRGDGFALTRLLKQGMEIFVLSKERNAVVLQRCKKLGIACLSACDDKLSALTEWASKKNIPLEEVVYIGNSSDDVACLKKVGCGVAVADASLEAKSAAKFVLSKPGGGGALAELCDLISGEW